MESILQNTMVISQRTATLSDASILLSWRNAQRVREFSLQSEPILLDQHLHWLSARLKRVRFEPLFLFSAENKPIGMSRLDRLSDSINKYEISILVDPSHHGKGIGRQILDMTCKSFFLLHPEKSLIARINKDNFKSQNLFSSAGFKLQSSTGSYLIFEKL